MVINLISQVVADGAERLLAGEIVAFQQDKELVNIGHRPPVGFEFRVMLRRRYCCCVGGRRADQQRGVSPLANVAITCRQA